MNRERQIKFHFLLPVWGELYVDRYLRVGLPCQLSEGNLGFLQKEFGLHKYKIYTTAKDATTIENSSAYTALNRVIKTEIHLIDDIVECYRAGKIHGHGAMTLCHGRGVMDANEEDAAIVFLVADAIIGESSFKNIYDLAYRGKRAIIVGSYSIPANRVIPDLLERYYSPEDLSISVPHRDLVKLSLEYLKAPRKDIDSSERKTFSQEWPLGRSWGVGDEGMIHIAGPHYPIMVYPLQKALLTPPEAALELDFSRWEGHPVDSADYVRQAVPDYNDVYVVEDSDEVISLGLDTKVTIPSNENKDETFQIKCSDALLPLRMAFRMKMYCYPYHFKYLKKKIRFHWRDFSPLWEEVEKEVDRFINDVEACMAILDRISPSKGINTDYYDHITDLFKSLHEVLGDIEGIVVKGDLQKAKTLFSRMLEEVDMLKGILLNNMAVLHMQEGNLAMAEWLLEHILREGYQVKEAEENLRILRGQTIQSQ